MKKFLILISLLTTGCATKFTKEVSSDVSIDLGKVIASSSLVMCSREIQNSLYAPRGIKNELLTTNRDYLCYGEKPYLNIEKGDELFLTKVVKFKTVIPPFFLTRWYILGEYEIAEKVHTFYYDLNWFQRSDGTFVKGTDEVIPW